MPNSPKARGGGNHVSSGPTGAAAAAGGGGGGGTHGTGPSGMLNGVGRPRTSISSISTEVEEGTGNGGRRVGVGNGGVGGGGTAEHAGLSSKGGGVHLPQTHQGRSTQSKQ